MFIRFIANRHVKQKALIQAVLGIVRELAVLLSLGALGDAQSEATD